MKKYFGGVKKISVLILFFFTSGLIAFSVIESEHALSVYDVNGKQYLEYDDFKNRIVMKYRILAIGEEHGNVRHHEIQKELIITIQKELGVERIVMEMIYPEQQIYIDRLYSEHIGIAYEQEHIPYLLKWNNQTWPWHFYKTIVEISIKNKIPLVHGNLSKKEVRAIRNGALTLSDGVTEDMISTLSLTIANAHQRLNMDDSHGHRRVRTIIHSAIDKRMSTNATGELHGVAIILAGRNHVRKDTGVGKFLASENSVACIGLMSYMGLGQGYTNQPFDYVVMTFGSKLEYFYFNFIQRVWYL